MTQLGQITNIRTQSGLSLTIPIQSDEDIRLSIIIQNSIGQAVFENTFELGAIATSLEFAIPEVEGGDYNAWIDVKGEVFIRRISVEPSPHVGLFGWIKKKLASN